MAASVGVLTRKASLLAIPHCLVPDLLALVHCQHGHPRGGSDVVAAARQIPLARNV